MIPAVYYRMRAPSQRACVPAIFLDRDGVIVQDIGYLHRAVDICYIDGALEAIASLNELGFPVVLITNQAGIGRGMYGWAEFEQVQERIERDLARHGGQLDGVWACAAHPCGIGELAHPSHPFRKPNPGMIYDAATRMQLDVGRSWLVGDKPFDIEAGLRAGIAGVCHVQTGYGTATRAEAERLLEHYQSNDCEFVPCASIADASHYIMGPLKKEAEELRRKKNGTT
jgi:D-glycero-D-manno-heptose 1,7-bisphosphate phosphatase